MLDIKILGKRIKELRLQHGLTQNEFANMLNVSFQAVSNWERGIAPPDLENLSLIATHFNILVDDLLRPRPDKLLLGIDGGGTKTKFVVSTMSGNVLKISSSSGSNPNDIGFDKAFSIISEGIHSALMEFPSISFVFCGIAGMSSGNYRARMIELLQKKYPSLKMDVQNDSANLFAFDDDADMTIISGTGSVAFVKRDEGNIRIGGWGYLFDTAGSAYDIGRDAITAALADEDALREPSLLTKLILKKLDSQSIWSNIPALYNGGKPYIASFASVVFEAYSKGDSTAIDIIDKSAKHLGELLELGINQYGARPRAVASGGVFEHFREIMLPHIKKYSSAEIIICDLPPIYGACRQAYKLSGKEEDVGFYENFKNSYRGI